MALICETAWFPDVCTSRQKHAYLFCLILQHTHPERRTERHCPRRRAFAVKVEGKRLPVSPFSGFELYHHSRNDAFYDLYNLLKVRKTGKREVVFLQPLPQTLYTKGHTVFLFCGGSSNERDTPVAPHCRPCCRAAQTHQSACAPVTSRKSSNRVFRGRFSSQMQDFCLPHTQPRGLQGCPAVHGFLALKETPPTRTLRQAYPSGPMAVLGLLAIFRRGSFVQDQADSASPLW